MTYSSTDLHHKRELSTSNLLTHACSDAVFMSGSVYDTVDHNGRSKIPLKGLYYYGNSRAQEIVYVVSDTKRSTNTMYNYLF